MDRERHRVAGRQRGGKGCKVKKRTDTKRRGERETGGRTEALRDKRGGDTDWRGDSGEGGWSVKEIKS